MKSKPFLIAVALIGMGIPGHSQECCKKQVSLVTVTGTSEIQVIPDQISIVLAVSEQSKDIKGLLPKLETKTNQILAIASKMIPDPKHIQTSSVSIQAIYGKEEDGKKVLNNEATRTICLTLTDLKKFDLLLSSCIEAGANRVTSTSLEIKDPTGFRRKAQEQAMKAAQEKALALATAINQTIGKAIAIRENSFGSASSNSFGYSDSESGQMGSLSIGTIKIVASVTVEFELK